MPGLVKKVNGHDKTIQYLLAFSSGMALVVGVSLPIFGYFLMEKNDQIKSTIEGVRTGQIAQAAQTEAVKALAEQVRILSQGEMEVVARLINKLPDGEAKKVK